MPDQSSWPPEGYVAVGNYAFEPPFVPTESQVEEAEQFIFSCRAFLNLQEGQRRRNVVRLAIAAAMSRALPEEEGSTQHNFIPLIGGTVRMTTTRHEGSPVFTYSLLQDQ